jgi:hypothetical protein
MEWELTVESHFMIKITCCLQYNMTVAGCQVTKLKQIFPNTILNGISSGHSMPHKNLTEISTNHKLSVDRRLVNGAEQKRNCLKHRSDDSVRCSYKLANFMACCLINHVDTFSGLSESA